MKEWQSDVLAVQPDADAQEAVRDRINDIVRPTGSFDRLDALVVWLAGWQRTEHPHIDHPAVIVFAGDHGVVVENVSQYPTTATAVAIRMISGGHGTIPVLANEVGASLTVVDCGVGNQTENLRTASALTEEQMQQAWDQGIDVVRNLPETTDLLLLGDVGIGNTTSAAAIACALLGWDPDLVGRGTGVDDETLARKRAVVSDAVFGRSLMEPLECLQVLGGSELVAVAAATVEARRRSIPMVLDGYGATAAVAPLEMILSGVLDHTIAGHLSSEPGHHKLLVAIKKEPLLDFHLGLGQASGAVMTIPILRMAIRAVLDVSTATEVRQR
ncbi:nicotinate-nucleotide--dimethylbenzimidazole phosphoribosyltransferase [bacterium BMS3Bbin02]|nr:nicotinate-nucleotide--dimethylbenzimidazole phosphoribosyltransferase [bacterium BMS3Bbin02]